MLECATINNAYERPLSQDQLVLLVSEVALLETMPSFFYREMVWIGFEGKKETIIETNSHDLFLSK